MLSGGTFTVAGGFWPGGQVATVSAPGHETASESFSLVGVRPYPAGAAGLNVVFSLSSTASAQLELLDVGGRRLLQLEVGSLGPGQHTVNLARDRVVAPGVYWVRLARGAERPATRVVVLEGEWCSRD